jgi:ATP10 protein
MKNKGITILNVLLLGVSSVFAQTGAKVGTSADRTSILNTPFPQVKAKTLLNNIIEFPAVAKNKIAIVCVAFNDEGRPKSDSWVKAVATKYADSSVVFYEIPMIKNAPKLLRGAIEKGMRKGTDIKLHNNVANYYGDISTYKKKLLMDDENNCYTFLLDKSGLILYSAEGMATPESLEEIDQKIKMLSK